MHGPNCKTDEINARMEIIQEKLWIDFYSKHLHQNHEMQ
jgi:hypothetical protein